MSPLPWLLQGCGAVCGRCQVRGSSAGRQQEISTQKTSSFGTLLGTCWGRLKRKKKKSLKSSLLSDSVTELLLSHRWSRDSDRDGVSNSEPTFCADTGAGRRSRPEPGRTDRTQKPTTEAVRGAGVRPGTGFPFAGEHRWIKAFRRSHPRLQPRNFRLRNRVPELCITGTRGGSSFGCNPIELSGGSTSGGPKIWPRPFRTHV